MSRKPPRPFAIDWKGLYRIEGGTFIFTDRHTGRITARPATPPTNPCELKISDIFG
jgi:hypothetical protein